MICLPLVISWLYIDQHYLRYRNRLTPYTVADIVDPVDLNYSDLDSLHLGAYH